MPQHDRLHLCPKTPPPPSNFSLVLHCPEPTHSLTSALHHCLDFMMTFSCSYVPHVDRIHDLHLSTLFTFPFLFVILPFLPSFISSSSCVCACLSPSIFRQTTMLAPNASLSHISHTVSCSCLYPITGASNHVCRTNSHIKCWRIRPFFVSHSHSHSDSLPPTPTPIPNTSPPHLPKRPDIILSMTRSRFLPHAHTYISSPLRYDTASVGVIFISILVTFLSSTPWHSPYRSILPYVSIVFYPYTS